MSTITFIDARGRPVEIQMTNVGTEEKPVLTLAVDSSGGTATLAPTQLPASLGPKASALSLSIVQASDGAFKVELPKEMLDILGQLRVSQEETLASYTQALFRDDDLWDTAIGGTATADWDVNSGGVVMTVLTAGDWCIRQSKLAARYVAGIPLNWAMSTIDISPEVGAIKRYGYGAFKGDGTFTEGDGFFLITDDTDIWVKILKHGVTIFEEKQVNWDDPMDGTGASGLTLNAIAFHAIGGSLLYFGGTDAVFGFIMNDKLVPVHTFRNSNVKESTFVRSPFQPLHVSISRTSGSGAAVAHQICSKVAAQGLDNTKRKYRDHLYKVGANRTVAASTVGTVYALLAVKKDVRFATVALHKAYITPASSETFILSVRRNPVIAGTAIAYTSTGFGYAVGYGDTAGNTIITGGSVIHEVEVTASGGERYVEDVDNLLAFIGDNIDGTSDEFVLCIEPLTANIVAKSGITTKYIG